MSIRHYVAIFAIIILLLFSLFGLITYHQVEKLQSNIEVSNSNVAKEELRSAINDAEETIKGYARNFAEWEEVAQQISNPLYYAYWHDHRALHAGILPKYALDGAIYTPSGEAISTLDTSTLPESIDPNSLSSYVDISAGKTELVVFEPVHDRSINKVLIGYVGIRCDLIPELTTARQFNYLDRESIQINLKQTRALPVSELIEHMSFSLKPNQAMDEIMNIVIDMLLRTAIIVGVPTLLLYPLVTYLIAHPLRRISQHIDDLKDNTAEAELPDFGRMLAVSELEKVRDSLNEYHKQLFEVHSSLDDKNRELWTLAHHDSLTGALNRRAFDEHWRTLSEMFSGSRMEICMAIFDVNNFKAFNDTYGHHAGDEVLKGISQSIIKVLRKGENLYRLGGDEFACVFVDCGRLHALKIAERCEKAVAAYPFSEYGINEPVRISIGLSHAEPSKHEELEDLQWKADIAMYSAKQPGKSHIAFYSDDMQKETKGLFSSSINNIVYEAVSSGAGICMHYQPIVKLDDEQPQYFEALIRIEHENQMVMPGDIFQLVEARRIEAELDLAILKQVHSDLQSGVIPKGTGVSVNVSGPSIVSQDIIKQLEKFNCFIDEYNLILEVTETALITQIEDAAENLSHLRQLGFLVALDDFGSGYSSVRYLAAMPVDIVKFDISLIRSLADDSQKTIVKHLASMISETGHKLVAEGIETEDLCKKVNELGFTYGQGYLFGRPEAEPNSWLEQRVS